MNALVFALLAVAAVSANLADEPCTPGEKKMDDCNSCFCAADGSGYACTKIACEEGVERRAIAEKVCEPGETKIEECNSCFCVSDGSGYACTRKACSNVKLTCEPGTSFKEYCNTCRCHADGLRKNAACTKAACPPGIWNQDGSLVNPEEQLTNDSNMRLMKRQADDTKHCVPGSTKMNDCNTCRCVGDPPGWACTRIACN